MLMLILGQVRLSEGQKYPTVLKARIGENTPSPYILVTGWRERGGGGGYQWFEMKEEKANIQYILAYMIIDRTS